MSKNILFKVQSMAIQAYRNGMPEFEVFGLSIRIQHAHDNEYQVLLPDGNEVYRLLDRGQRGVALLAV